MRHQGHRLKCGRYPELCECPIIPTLSAKGRRRGDRQQHRRASPGAALCAVGRDRRLGGRLWEERPRRVLGGSAPRVSFDREWPLRRGHRAPIPGVCDAPRSEFARTEVGLERTHERLERCEAVCERGRRVRSHGRRSPGLVCLATARYPSGPACAPVLNLPIPVETAPSGHTRGSAPIHDEPARRCLLEHRGRRGVD